MKIIIAIFLAIGIIFSSVGLYIFIPIWNLIQNSQLISGKVVDLNYMNDGKAAPVVSYNCIGKDYKKQSSLYSNPHPNIGDHIEIYCSNDNPNNFVINSFIDKYFGLFFAGIGSVFFLIGLGFLIYLIKRMQFIEYIKLNGKIIEAPVTFIGFNNNIRVNGRNPCIFEVQYIDKFDNSVYTFKSDNIWYDINQLVKIGDLVKIYVNERDYKKYYVDLSFLPGKK